MSPEHSPDDLTDLVADWPGQHRVLALATENEVIACTGDLDWSTRIASVTKLFVTWAALIAIEEGTISLDDPAGPSGSTVRHLLSHTSGLGFEDPTPLFSPGQRRVYSNVGIEQLAEHIEHAAGIAFWDYLQEGVLVPLGLTDMVADGSPAQGMHGSVAHLLVFAREVMNPTLLDPSTVNQATSPVYRDLKGVLPGFGPADPNPWGLGFEIRGMKSPHWTAPSHPATTFGHFGGSGSFLWIDPTRRLIGASLSDQPFGDWAVQAWPLANQALIERYG